MKIVFLVLVLIINFGCVESGSEMVKEQDLSNLKVYQDKEFKVLCFLSVMSDKGINCIKGELVKPTKFAKGDLSNLERYYDSDNSIVCYQSRMTNSGVSCINLK